MKTILIVEDDIAMNKGVAFALRKEGYNVICAYTKKDGKSAIMRNNIDFLLLDINLPDGSGLEFCNQMKDKMNFPIVLFTANDTDEDMIKGYKSGCDDYIAKPFSIEVLKFKINAILKNRENTNNNKSNIFQYKNLKVDFESRKVFIKDEEVYLTVKEYKLLELLCKNKGKAMTKELLLEKIWDCDGNYVDENALSVNVGRLRRKIEDDTKNPQYIITLFGIGYILGE